MGATNISGQQSRIQYLEKRLQESNEENIDLMDRLKSAVSKLNQFDNKQKNMRTSAVQVDSLIND